MGDQDDRFAFFAQTIQNPEQLIGLGRGQHACRFIKDQDFGLTIERLEDLNPLLVAHAEVFNQRVRVDVQFIFFGEVLQLLAGLGQRRAQQAAIFGAQDDVFQNGEVFHQFEVLKHHANASRDRRLAVRDGGLLTFDKDLTSVCLVETIEDRHQGGFPCAVFPDDPVDRSRLHRDRNVLVSLDRAKGFGDAFEF